MYVNKHTHKSLYVYYRYTYTYTCWMCYCTWVTKMYKMHFSSQSSCSLEEGRPWEPLIAVPGVTTVTVGAPGRGCGGPRGGERVARDTAQGMMPELVSSEPPPLKLSFINIYKLSVQMASQPLWIRRPMWVSKVVTVHGGPHKKLKADSKVGRC